MKENNDFNLDIVYLDDEVEMDETITDDFKEYDEKPTVKSGPPSKKKKRSKRKSSGSAPVGKIVKGTGKAAFRIIGMAFRLATFVLIGYILYLLFTNFWNGKNEYGDIMNMFSEKNYTLAAYSGTALLLVLYELSSLIWSFTSRAAREDGRIRKLDTGRGFFSFILIYAGALASQIFAHVIPSSPAFLTGIEGALNIYGSLTATLLPICVAGIICSLLRKIAFH